MLQSALKDKNLLSHLQRKPKFGEKLLLGKTMWTFSFFLWLYSSRLLTEASVPLELVDVNGDTTREGWRLFYLTMASCSSGLTMFKVDLAHWCSGGLFNVFLLQIFGPTSALVFLVVHFFSIPGVSLLAPVLLDNGFLLTGFRNVRRSGVTRTVTLCAFS